MLDADLLIRPRPQISSMPMVWATLVSVGLHGLIWGIQPVLPFFFKPPSETQRKVRLLQLNPSEMARLPEYSLPQPVLPSLQRPLVPPTDILPPSLPPATSSPYILPPINSSPYTIPLKPSLLPPTRRSPQPPTPRTETKPTPETTPRTERRSPRPEKNQVASRSEPLKPRTNQTATNTNQTNQSSVQPSNNQTATNTNQTNQSSVQPSNNQTATNTNQTNQSPIQPSNNQTATNTNQTNQSPIQPSNNQTPPANNRPTRPPIDIGNHPAISNEELPPPQTGQVVGQAQTETTQTPDSSTSETLQANANSTQSPPPEQNQQLTAEKLQSLYGYSETDTKDSDVTQGYQHWWEENQINDSNASSKGKTVQTIKSPLDVRLPNVTLAGIVVLVDPNGKIVGEPKLIRSTGYPILNQLAISHVKQQTFKAENETNGKKPKNRIYIFEIEIDQKELPSIPPASG